jgi:toxin ParE1/3/4
VERLVQAVDILEDHPEAGRVVPELGRKDIREVIRGSYRIVYLVSGEVIHILTVFHASRLLPPDVSDRG